MKIYYNKDGWLCHRAPCDFQDEVGFIDVSEEEYQKTLCTEKNFAWKVVNGTLTNVRVSEMTESEVLEELRHLRENECFQIVNRGVVWYNTLTETQLNEINVWYKKWLDVTITKTVPTRPSWIH